MRRRLACLRGYILPLASLLLAGCGRIGFDYTEVEGESAEQDSEEPEEDDAGRAAEPAAESGVEQADAGDAATPVDGWSGGLTSGDAGRDGAAAADGGAPRSDGGVAVRVDAGRTDAAVGPADAAAADGGGVRDAGAPRSDAATPVDAGVATPPAAGATVLACGDPGLIACDDFNGHRSGTTVSLAGGASVTSNFVTAPVSSSTTRSAAHVSFNGVTDGALYLRYSLYVPSNVALTGLSIARLGRFDATSDFGFDLRLVRDGEVELSTSAGIRAGTSGYKLPRDRWLCVQVQAEVIDSSTGSIRASINGAQVAAASNVDTEPTGGIAAAATAIESTFNGQGAASVYVDNVLLVSQPPPACP